MDPVQKIYRLLIFVIVGTILWRVFPFLAPIIGMLRFSFLFTTIFLQAADSLERYTRSRSLGVFIILSSVIALGIAFIGSFISNMGSQIKSFSQKIQRDDFSTSYRDSQPIAVHEFLYPLMQGYDSVVLKSDVELGGTDQKFNLLVGRELQKQYDIAPQIVLTVPLLEGLNGGQKMSKSLGNSVGITESPVEMYGKLMWKISWIMEP